MPIVFFHTEEKRQMLAGVRRFFGFRVHSDRKWWMRWSQKITYKVNIKMRLHMMWRPLPSSLHRSNLEIFKFLGDIAWRCAATVNQCRDFPDINDILMSRTLLEFAERTLNQTWWSKQPLLCQHCGAPTTRLHTPQLRYEHRHNIVRFSNLCGTSTTDAVQKWRLYPSS